MDVDKYIFDTKESALAAMKEADNFWIDQRYTGDEDYIPQGKVCGIIIVDDVIEFHIPEGKEPEFYVAVNEFTEYFVSKETRQWELAP